MLKELQCNYWNEPADLRVVTTNGMVKKNGECVMGRGNALQANKRHPKLAKELGKAILTYGNRPYIFPEYRIATLPVKHHWKEKADIRLIIPGLYQLCELIKIYQIKNVLLPRPGCSNGQLDWDDIRNMVEYTLSAHDLLDTVTVVYSSTEV